VPHALAFDQVNNVLTDIAGAIANAFDGSRHEYRFDDDGNAD